MRRAMSVPRACGDDPPCGLFQVFDAVVFPAHAGMIPVISRARGRSGCVPRACGDDPANTTQLNIQLECSPRMRG